MKIKVTDHNGAGAFATVDFDTSAGAATLTPSNAQFFTDMQLTLQ